MKTIRVKLNIRSVTQNPQLNRWDLRFIRAILEHGELYFIGICSVVNAALLSFKCYDDIAYHSIQSSILVVYGNSLHLNAVSL